MPVQLVRKFLDVDGFTRTWRARALRTLMCLDQLDIRLLEFGICRIACARERGDLQLVRAAEQLRDLSVVLRRPHAHIEIVAVF